MSIDNLAALNDKRVLNNIERVRESCARLNTIYTDVDGTLLGPGGSVFLDHRRNLTTKPAEAIIRALTRDIDVVMVSGRHPNQLLETARVLGFNNYIAEMGTMLIYDRGARQVLNLKDFDPGTMTAYEAMQASGVLDFLLDEFKSKLEYHLPWSRTRECTALLRGFIDAGTANSLMQQAGFPDFYIVDNGRISRRSESLLVDEVHAYHVIPIGVSKSQGVALDRELRDIPRENTIAIGDSLADLEFADEVGIFFMLANGIKASPQAIPIIAAADNIFITDNEMNVGWAEIINAILK